MIFLIQFNYKFPDKISEKSENADFIEDKKGDLFNKNTIKKTKKEPKFYGNRDLIKKLNNKKNEEKYKNTIKTLIEVKYEKVYKNNKKNSSIPILPFEKKK